MYDGFLSDYIRTIALHIFLLPCENISRTIMYNLPKINEAEISKQLIILFVIAKSQFSARIKFHLYSRICFCSKKEKEKKIVKILKFYRPLKIESFHSCIKETLYNVKSIILKRIKNLALSKFKNNVSQNIYMTIARITKQ